MFVISSTKISNGIILEVTNAAMAVLKTEPTFTQNLQSPSQIGAAYSKMEPTSLAISNL